MIQWPIHKCSHLNLFNKRLNDSLKTVTCHHLLLVLVSCLKNHFKQQQQQILLKRNSQGSEGTKKKKEYIHLNKKIYIKKIDISFLSISHHYTPLSWLIPIYEWEKQTLQLATNQSKALERKNKKCLESLAASLVAYNHHSFPSGVSMVMLLNIGPYEICFIFFPLES